MRSHNDNRECKQIFILFNLYAQTVAVMRPHLSKNNDSIPKCISSIKDKSQLQSDQWCCNELKNKILPVWKLLAITQLYYSVSLILVKCDPCDETVYKQLPYEGNRILNNVIKPPSGHRVISDRELPHDWYRAGGSMPTSPPPLYSCGTIFPIWLHGKQRMVSIENNSVIKRCLINAILIINKPKKRKRKQKNTCM